MPELPLTITLRAAHDGDRAAADRAYTALYPELLQIARSRLRGHGPRSLLDTQALVHESFMRFIAAKKLCINDRKHFFTYAAKTMRNIVIDYARHRQTARMGGGAERVTLGSQVLGELAKESTVIDVDAALRELEALDPTLAQVVEMRYFGGFSDAEIAASLDISDRTVRRHWDKARAFMLTQLQP